MRSLRNLPIRQKVSAIIMLTTATALAVACSAFILYDYISLRRTTLNDLRVLASVVAAKSAANTSPANPDGRTFRTKCGRIMF